MRRTYQLSVETIKVLNGSATKVAEEFGCDPAYIHQILGQTVTDPFAKFEWLYQAAKKAECDTSPWRNRLDAIDAKHSQRHAYCVPTETAKAVKENSDIAVAAIDRHQSLYDQLKEVCQAQKQLGILYNALIAAINADKEAEGQPHARFNGPVSTRDTVREMVKRRTA